MVGVSGALIGGAVLGGSILGSNSANKNAKRAAQTSADNNAANIALQRESRDMALQRLDPYASRGNVAGNAINALLGLGGSEPMTAPTAPPTAASRYGLGDNGQMPYARGFGSAVFNRANLQNGNPMLSGGTMQTTAMPQQPAPQSAQQAQQAAFDRFRNSTGYQFRVAEGQDALNSGFAGSGLVQSGAALRALDD